MKEYLAISSKRITFAPLFDANHGESVHPTTLFHLSYSMEGQNLLSMVKGRVYNADLRNELIKAGMRRIASTQWISKETAERYELILSDDDEKSVLGVDLVDGNHRVHLVDPEEERAAQEEAMAEAAKQVPAFTPLNVHHKTYNALMKQLEVSDSFLDLMDRWNEEMYRGTALGEQLRATCQQPQIAWDNFLFLPDPMASGEYIFGTIRKGVAAAMHAWLNMPDDRYIVPTDGTTDGAYDSLQVGLEFHRWEFENFETAAAAGQYAIKMLNSSETTYAQTIHRLLGKEDAKISRNDFYRNADNVMCRVEVVRDEYGIHITDVPCLPTVADCIDSLLAPYIKARALSDHD